MIQNARLVFAVALLALAASAYPAQTGPKGDGIADDSAAIQAEVDACPKGGAVTLPKGKYLLQHTVKLHADMTLQGMGADSQIIKAKDLIVAIDASEAPNLSVQNLGVVVEKTTSAVMKGLLIHFRHCANVSLTGCSLDGAAEKGLPSQFSLCQFECCNDVKCFDNQFRNTAGSGTGVTGASAELAWGHRSEFARNVVEEYCDTGIGIWTGASDANIHDNRLHARAERFTSYPVGIDVDGGTHSRIVNNDISGGQIAIRLFDVHNGVYPIEGIVIQGNYLHDQLNYDGPHPALAVKPENPKSRIEATIVKNRISESAPNALGLMGGGEGHTVLHVDDNEFSGGTFWSFGWYKDGALDLYSDGAKVDWKATQGKNNVH